MVILLTSAVQIKYRSLGTFEFLLHPETGEFYFLEINPRLQVEHTITESICSIDIVKVQLQLAQGLSFEQTDLANIDQDPLKPPPQRSIQLRVTAEDPEKNYSLSIGKIQSFHFPFGNGVRVDTALVHGAPAVVSADFDSVIAKIIITAPTWDGAVHKARRALQETTITGVKTNLDILAAIVSHVDFLAGACDTQWLESHHEELLAASAEIRKNRPASLLPSQPTSSLPTTASTSAPLFRPNDAWTFTLTPTNQPSQSQQQQQPQHLTLTRLLRADFPTSLSAEVTHTPPSSSAQPQSYTLHLQSTTASAHASQHRMGSRDDPRHVLVPFAGTLVEVLVDVGDEVREGETVCVVRQMKMEVEVRARRGGVVGFVTEAEEGEEVGEGVLVAVLEGREGARL